MSQPSPTDRPTRRSIGRRMGPGVAASLLLHALLLAAVLVWQIRLPAPPPKPPDHQAVVQVVMGNGEPPGQPAPPAKPSPPKPKPAHPPAPQPHLPPPPLPQAADALPVPATPSQSPEVRLSSPPRPTAPPEPDTVQPTPPANTAQPVVRLGSPDSRPAARVDQDLANRIVPAKGDSHNLPPLYPSSSALRGEQGHVLVRLHIDELGQVARVDILNSPVSPRLERAVREAVRTWHFTPAVRDGKPVPDSLEINFDFELN